MLGCDSKPIQSFRKTAEGERTGSQLFVMAITLSLKFEFFVPTTIKAERLLQCLPMDIHLFSGMP